MLHGGLKMFNFNIDENEILDLINESDEKVYCVYKKGYRLIEPETYLILDGNDVKKINASKSGEKHNLMTKADAKKAAKIANSKDKFAKYRIADYYRKHGMTKA